MKIVVACGGLSPEREVSLNSGAAVCAALNNAGVEATLVDVKEIRDFLINWPEYNAEGVYVALHGGWGEDGTFQNALEAFNIPFTGSASDASFLGMNKYLAKLVFKDNGVPVPDGILVKNDSPLAKERVSEFFEKHKKIIVKPNSGGSTVGVTIVTAKEEIDAALSDCWSIEPFALVEEFIEGDELTVPVMEQESGICSALPPIMICPKTGFYDYKNKYTSGATEYKCPAPVPSQITSKLSEIAVRAHNSLGCRVYSRVDFRMNKNGELYVLEINTAPGMTATSLVPKAAGAAGYDFPDFLKKVIVTSFSRNK